MAQTGNYYQRPNQHQKKSNEETFEQKVIIGFFKGLIWLATLPFTGLKGKGGLTGRRKAKVLNRALIDKQWRDIQTMIGLGGTSHFGQAVVAADRLLDYVLKESGYRGETMGERLKSAASDMSPSVYSDTWQAHKLRNQLVHEVDGEAMSWQAKEAIKQYEQALRDLGALS